MYVPKIPDFFYIFLFNINIIINTYLPHYKLTNTGDFEDRNKGYLLIAPYLQCCSSLLSPCLLSQKFYQCAALRTLTL